MNVMGLFGGCLDHLIRKSPHRLPLIIGVVRVRPTHPVVPAIQWAHHRTLEADVALILTDDQQVNLSIAPKSLGGNPAAVDGKPTWTSSDPTVLTLTVSDDGLSALAVTTGKLGVAQVQVAADADLGPGVRPLTALLDVTVKAGEAVSLGIDAGAPAPRVAPPPAPSPAP